MSMIQYRLFSAAQYRETWGEPARRPCRRGQMVAGPASGSRADLSLALDNDDALEAGPGVPPLQPVAAWITDKSRCQPADDLANP